MTIQELIEKMKKDSERRIAEKMEYNGAFIVLKDWYEEIQDCTDFEGIQRLHERIYGIFYGLKAAYFITDTEFQQIYDELMRLYKEKIKKLFDATKGKSL